MGRDMTTAFTRHVRDARDRHALALTQLETWRREMTATHVAARKRLDASQEARRTEETCRRQERFNKGLHGLWDVLTGRHARLSKQNRTEAETARVRDRRQRQALIDAQLKDGQALQAENRDLRTHHTTVLRDLYRDSQHFLERARNVSTDRAFHTNQMAESPRTCQSSTTERLRRLRDGRGAKSTGRDRGPEPDP